MTKNKIYSLITIVVIAILSIGFFLACEEKDNTINNINKKSIEGKSIEEFADFAKIHSEALDEVYNRLSNINDPNLNEEHLRKAVSEAYDIMEEKHNQMLNEIDIKYGLGGTYNNEELPIICEQYLNDIFYDLEERDTIFYSEIELKERIFNITTSESFNNLDEKSKTLLYMSFAILIDSYFYCNKSLDKWDELYVKYTGSSPKSNLKGRVADAQFYANTHNSQVAKADARGAAESVASTGLMAWISKPLIVATAVAAAGSALVSSARSAFNI